MLDDVRRHLLWQEEAAGRLLLVDAKAALELQRSAPSLRSILSRGNGAPEAAAPAARPGTLGPRPMAPPPPAATSAPPGAPSMAPVSHPGPAPCGWTLRVSLERWTWWRRVARGVPRRRA
ncbi:hypothetical protein ACLESO_47645, partial [Pyxidicoccus sp. 3LG]